MSRAVNREIGDNMQAFKTTDRSALTSKKRLLLFAAVAFLGVINGADAQTVLRVEEDWEMVLGTPDPTADSPQVTTAMAPIDNIDGSYCAFELNFQSLPDFNPGGLHIHAWAGDNLVGSAHAQGGATLNNASEHIQWTQAMSLSNGELMYEILDGSSDTWGAFGDGLQLLVGSGFAFDDLNGYDPAVSVANSGVGYGSNRVMSLRLKTVRLTTSEGDEIVLQVNQDVLPSGN